VDDTSIAPATFAERLLAAVDKARVVAVALADIPPDLPQPDSHYIRQDGRVDLSFGYFSGDEAAVARWGAHFGAGLVLDFSASGYLFTVVDLAEGVTVRVDVNVSQRRAYELGALLQIPVNLGGQVQIDASALLNALLAEAGTRVTS
jgi:hypothetical protein